MYKQIKRHIAYSLLAFLLSIGLLVSSIGVTWCRYQVVKEKNVTYRVKGVGNFFIESERNEWILNPKTGLLELKFSVSNTDPETEIFKETSHSFYIRWQTKIDTNIAMPIVQPSGRVITYTSDKILNEDQETYTHYFLDENGKEILFNLEGNKTSKQDICLQMERYDQAFLSEIIIVDASYDLRAKSSYITSQYYPMEVTSNYLSDTENLNIVINDSVDITLMTNQAITSKIIATTQSENIEVTFMEKEIVEEDTESSGEIDNPDEIIETQETYKNELDINVEANKEAVVTMNFLQTGAIETSEIIGVTWQIFNTSNEIEKELKANFIYTNQTSSNTAKPGTVTMEFVDDNHSFSQIKPLELYVTSDVDTIVELKESILPKGTRYSLDSGANWYVLGEAGGIDLPLTANQKQHLIIDFSHTDIEWFNQIYDLSIYHSYDMLATLQFDMKVEEEAEKLEILKSNTGIINLNPIIFTVNQSDVTIEVEYLKGGIYESIDITSLFALDSPAQNAYILTVKNDVVVPEGTYQINVTNSNGEQINLAFFVIDTEENETNQDETEQTEANV